MSSEGRYCLAVWVEGRHEVEDIIATSWIKNSNVRFPRNPKPSLIHMILSCAKPDKSWFRFPLKKIKLTGGM